MITKDEEAPAASPRLAIALLLVGIAIGLFIDPAAWIRSLRQGLRDVERGAPAELAPVFVPAEDAPEVPRNGLETLSIEVALDDATKLQDVRDRALATGVIEQGPEHTIDARVTFGTGTNEARVRIKGDWTDHVDSRKWSLRVELADGAFQGMRRFSIQRPATRGYLWEWLVGQAAAREGILRPRSTFVNVVINGNPNGIYFLEEHFAKELLESQGRREGPIVKFDESTLWTTRLQNHLHRVAQLPPALRPAMDVDDARVIAFSEKQMARSDGLARQLQASIERLADLQNLVIASSDRQTLLRRLQALEDLEGRTVDDLVDTRTTARLHALMSVFKASHGAIWHNMRFYVSPVTNRLEPILFDTGAGEAETLDPVAWQYGAILRELARSSDYYVGHFEELGRFTDPGWIDGLFGAVREELVRFDAAMHAEGLLPPTARAVAVRNQIHAHAIGLRELCLPRAGASFVAALHEREPPPDDGGGAAGGDTVERVVGDVEVEAWAATRAPMVLEGFRFGNGRFVPAGTALIGSGTLSPENVSRRGEHGVVLPTDGRHLRFRFPADVRLATLRDLQQIKDAALAEMEKDQSVRLVVDAVFRPAAAGTADTRRLFLRRVRPRWFEQGAGRPEQPTLEGVLAAHECLRYDAEEDRLSIASGIWEVDGDLVLPPGRTLHVQQGVRLRFDEGALLFTTGALEFAGTQNFAVVLEPKPGVETWGGIVVLGAEERSRWRNVTVRKTAGIERGGWVMTGAVTFYASAVTIEGGGFEDNLAEDALNVVSADFLVAGARFLRFASDGFDGDFVTGTVARCYFEGSGGDGLDFSGCRVVIEECRFKDIGDKAISIGEAGYAEVRDVVIDSANIALASKDGSHVVARGVDAQRSTQYAVTAYVKKPVYGPAKIDLEDLVVGETGRGSFLVQTGCSVTSDGEVQPSEDIDVKQLYKDKILGT